MRLVQSKGVAAHLVQLLSSLLVPRIVVAHWVRRLLNLVLQALEHLRVFVMDPLRLILPTPLSATFYRFWL